MPHQEPSLRVPSQIKFLPTANVLDYGEDLALHLTTVGLTEQAVTFSSAAITRSLDAGGQPLDALPHVYSDTDSGLLLHEGDGNQDGKNPGKDSSGGSRHQTTGHQEKIGCVIGGTTSFRYCSPTSGNRTINNIRHDGQDKDDPRNGGRKRIGPGHQEDKGKDQEQAENRQQVGHGVESVGGLRPLPSLARMMHNPD